MGLLFPALTCVLLVPPLSLNLSLALFLFNFLHVHYLMLHAIFHTHGFNYHLSGKKNQEKKKKTPELSMEPIAQHQQLTHSSVSQTPISL